MLAAELISWDAFFVAFAVLGEALAVLFVYRVLVRGGSPASTVLWMAVILAAPWIGLLFYYLLPRRLQLRRLRAVRTTGARFRASRERAAAGLAAEGEPPASGLRAFLSQAAGVSLAPDNELCWLPSGADFTAAARAAIEAAECRVELLVYIFRGDRAGARLLDVLTAAAARGVEVRLLYDSIGSWGLGDGDLAGLRAAGGRAVAFLPLLWKRRPFTVNLRNHRKLLIVDGKIGFVGGRNVGDEYFTDRVGRERRWLDAMLQVRGPSVAHMQQVFAEDWFTATEEALTELPVPPKMTGAGACAVGIVCSGPDREQSDLWFAFGQAVTDAKSTVDLSSPYLVPPPTLMFLLQLAAARGVRVRIHTNGPKAEAAVLYHAQRSYYRRLLEGGVEIYETTTDYNHAKVLVVDGNVVVVGSANMDLRSAHLNFEIAAVALDAAELGRQVLATLEERHANCRRVSVSDLPSNPLLRALDGFCGLLSPVL